MTVAPKPIAKWLLKHYSLLWHAFHERSYSFKDAQKALGIRDPRQVGTVLSLLRRACWITNKESPIEARRRVYFNAEPNDLLDALGTGDQRES